MEGVALKHIHSHVEIRLSMRLPHDTGSSIWGSVRAESGGMGKAEGGPRGKTHMYIYH